MAAQYPVHRLGRVDLAIKHPLVSVSSSLSGPYWFSGLYCLCGPYWSLLMWMRVRRAPRGLASGTASAGTASSPARTICQYRVTAPTLRDLRLLLDDVAGGALRCTQHRRTSVSTERRPLYERRQPGLKTRGLPTAWPSAPKVSMLAPVVHRDQIDALFEQLLAGVQLVAAVVVGRGQRKLKPAGRPVVRSV